ncbi:hypothetical protein QQS21_005593 [Conoideocrella luteorostrata]|uniref:C2H2-type domain-containing protein n=1 Tax=Conoideocrella luteorostrata TaxID=1105319 RepID=A0AAJ0CRK7_9HYPO|nr:hypothetical protein QQS21_005593 [Conoideocrella luteorostrata]
MEVTSFSSRRPATGALPAFSLPPPNSEVPSMALFTHRFSSPFGLLPSSPLTSSPGASDGLSPSLSSVHTTSSQGSQAHGLQYTYSTSHVGPQWSTPASSNYHVGPTSPDQPYGSRSSLYGQQQHIGFANPRSSQSPATAGEGLPPPPYNHLHQPFQTPVSGGGNGGQDSHHMPSSQPPPPHGAMLNSTQPHSSAGAPAPADPYAHSRPPSNPSYYAASTTPQQASFPSYASHQQQHSPTGTSPGSRSMSHHPAMAPPPGSYRPYGSYQSLGSMNGPVMSNIHHPGSQMSMIPAIPVPPYGTPQMIYGHTPQPQSERPFKCDQCTQSFSRNHDLKRHKRIHLAVKPFPCSFCSKSFSRKDALKRHRLVKGCENKTSEAPSVDDNGQEQRPGDGEDDRSSIGKES